MEISHKKLGITLTLPEVFTGKHYATYTQVLDEKKEEYKTPLQFPLRAYLAAVAICDKAIYKEHDLKKMGLDAPLKVVRWVGDRVTDYINQETEVPEA